MRICITRSERHAYSETFINDQIAQLSKVSDVFPIHSGRFPERNQDNSLLSPLPFWIMHKMLKGLLGRNNYFSNYGVKKFLITNKIDVVIANYGLAAAHMVDVCNATNTPLIAIFHGHDATDRKLVAEYTERYKTLFRGAAHLVAVSEDIRQKLISLGADDKKISVVPCGVDITKFKPAEQKREQMLLAVGRFVRKKGPLYTIRAFNEAHQQFPNAKLTMVGAHQGLFDECLETVRALGIEEAVNFPGVLKHEEVSNLMNKALAFVQHSMTAPNGDTEGTPVSVVEASAAGLPVISTYHGGIKQAIIHEKTGFLVEEGDIHGMAQYMKKILGNHVLAKEMGLVGRSHIELNYSQELQINKLYKLAQEAIQR